MIENSVVHHQLYNKYSWSAAAYHHENYSLVTNNIVLLYLKGEREREL